MRAFFNVHYILIYQTVTSLTYVFVPLDFKPRIQIRVRIHRNSAILSTIALLESSADCLF
ncbi:hypothetical protein EXW99_23335 [Escherichia coli]|nr:hypothetical protein EXW99_23335 [Escherichia coli]